MAERHDDSSKLKVFTRLGRELLACDDNDPSYFYIQDIRGDVVALVNVDGTVAAIRGYDASGRMISKAPREHIRSGSFLLGTDLTH